MNINRVILIVLDGVGCGDAPDAGLYGDPGANTLGNIGQAVGGLNLPHLGQLGLGHTTKIQGVPPERSPLGAYGRLTEKSSGKDTTTGHWELCGVILDCPFPVFPHGFPESIISQFEQRIGRKTLGNYPASGTEIIRALGEKHLQTGMPIIYTSADSVFQIAAHEDIIPVDELYHLCQMARDLLVGDYAVGRVIARPFTGRPGQFTRTERRKDFSLEPPVDTLLDHLKTAGLEVIGVGKIEDIFAHKGLTASNHTPDNQQGVNAILDYLKKDFRGLLFANLVDFDMLYGHRNDAPGFARALESFDQRLPEIYAGMRSGDVLMITADHGNDPTTPGTDHSRERVPVLVAGKPIRPGVDIGTRETFADLGATVSELLGLQISLQGASFLDNMVS